MRYRRCFVITLGVLLLAVLPASAWAHPEEDEEEATAFDLARQAIALIVNKPHHMDDIAHKIDDVLAAKDTTDVDITVVEQAKLAMADGNLERVRALLEQSIGARPHMGAVDPAPMGERPPPTQAEPQREPGTEGEPQPATPHEADAEPLAVLDAMPGRTGFTGGDWVMLGVAIIIGLVGIAFSLRLRPRNLPHPGPVPR